MLEPIAHRATWPRALEARARRRHRSMTRRPAARAPRLRDRAAAVDRDFGLARRRLVRRGRVDRGLPRPDTTGTSTSSPRSWSTSRTSSGSGASATSRRRAHHRLQARHRRNGGVAYLKKAARRRPVPGAVGSADAALARVIHERARGDRWAAAGPGMGPVEPFPPSGTTTQRPGSGNGLR